LIFSWCILYMISLDHVNDKLVPPKHDQLNSYNWIIPISYSHFNEGTIKSFKVESDRLCHFFYYIIWHNLLLTINNYQKCVGWTWMFLLQLMNLPSQTLTSWNSLALAPYVACINLPCWMGLPSILHNIVGKGFTIVISSTYFLVHAPIKILNLFCMKYAISDIEVPNSWTIVLSMFWIC
jgi:hypothetical protein